MHRARIPLLLAALASSVATSSVPGPFIPTLAAQTVLHNASDAPITLISQVPLQDPICEVLADHRELLGSLEWGPPREIVVQPHENQPVSPFLSGSCTVARLEIPDVGTRIVAAFADDFPEREFPVTYETLDQVERAVVVLAPGTVQPLRPTSPGLVFEEPAPLAECRLPAEALWWRAEYQGPGTIVDRADDDGCTTLTIEGIDHREHLVDLCAAETEVPFDVGDDVVVSGPPGSLSIILDGPPDVTRAVWLVTDPYALPYGLGVLPATYAELACLEDAACLRGVPEALEVRRVGVTEPLAEIEEGDAVELELDGARAALWVGAASTTLTTACAGRLEATLVVRAQ